MHTVIGGEHRDRGGFGQRRRALAREPREPHRQILERTERARRLGHPGLVVAGRGHRGLVEWSDLGHDLREQIHRLLPWQATRAVLLRVHGPVQRPAAGPASLLELRLSPELADLTRAEVRDDLQMIGKAQLGGEFALIEKADPANADALGAGREPQVGDGEHRRVRCRLRLHVTPQRVLPAAGPVARDDDVDRRVKD